VAVRISSRFEVARLMMTRLAAASFATGFLVATAVGVVGLGAPPAVAQSQRQGIESQPVPPPGGLVPRQPIQPRPQAAPQAQPAPPAAGPQVETSPDGDVTVVQPPSVKIANGFAVFAGLDKITGRIRTFDVAIGETVQFPNEHGLQVTPRVCYTRPATEQQNTTAFAEVNEVTPKGEARRIFTGWMFASSPGLHGVEHPIYDVWLVGCKAPVPETTAGQR
jgi:hypothetical protein